MFDLIATTISSNNLPTATNQTISQIESGAALIVLGLIARSGSKFIKEQRKQGEDQKTLSVAFAEHIKDDKRNNKNVLRFMKSQKKASKRYERAAIAEREVRTNTGG